jgi:hypothetical protein
VNDDSGPKGPLSAFLPGLFAGLVGSFFGSGLGFWLPVVVSAGFVPTLHPAGLIPRERTPRLSGQEEER